MGRLDTIRAEIMAGRCRGQALKELIFGQLELDSGNYGKIGYDELDTFVNCLLSVREMPVPTVELTAEMVEFYKTPVRVVLEMADRVSWGPGDVFFDLGSGLGQVVVLIHLLMGVAARGVEIEPAYCDFASDCALQFGLAGVDFVEGDARVVDLSAGTVFFLFTPFKGQIFLEVMERLRVLALAREIRVIGYGPCSAEIPRLGWLRREGDEDGGERGESAGEYVLQIFRSCLEH
jgi:SAM-dependent methyltransferase